MSGGGGGLLAPGPSAVTETDFGENHKFAPFESHTHRTVATISQTGGWVPAESKGARGRSGPGHLVLCCGTRDAPQDLA